MPSGGKREGAGRPALPEKRLNLTFRVSPEERNIIIANAEKAGLKMSEYLRYCALNVATDKVNTRKIKQAEEDIKAGSQRSLREILKDR